MATNTERDFLGRTGTERFVAKVKALLSNKQDKGDYALNSDVATAINKVGAVSYNAQTLTDAQKSQARANIGAGISDVKTWEDIDGTLPVTKGGVPSSTSSDNGKVLRVVDGAASWVATGNNRVVLTDHTTGTPFILYVDNGELCMEEGTESGEDITMIDRTTGVAYVLYVADGKLTMAESAD